MSTIVGPLEMSKPVGAASLTAKAKVAGGGGGSSLSGGAATEGAPTHRSRRKGGDWKAA